MAVDEAILEHTGQRASAPTLRLYEWEPACLSLGHAQPFADVDVDRLRARGWDVVRRVTGGRAILHTDELTYSVIGRADEAALSGSVLESYHKLAKALIIAVQELNLPVEMLDRAESPASQNTNPVCFEVPSTSEIIVHGKKMIGSAQARRKEGVLQHGSLPLHGDLTRICDALHFNADEERTRAADRLLARATTVESVLGQRIDSETAAAALVRGFEVQLGIRLEPEELSKSECERAEELVVEKYANDAWTHRA